MTFAYFEYQYQYNTTIVHSDYITLQPLTAGLTNGVKTFKMTMGLPSVFSHLIRSMVTHERPYRLSLTSDIKYGETKYGISDDRTILVTSHTCSCILLISIKACDWGHLSKLTTGIVTRVEYYWLLNGFCDHNYRTTYDVLMFKFNNKFRRWLYLVVNVI